MTEETTPPISPEVEEDYKDKYFRLLADMENARKRLQKEKQEMMRYAADNLLSEILQPIETFENALGFAGKMSEETRNWAMGFQMILTQFKDIMTQHGIVPYSSLGERFDPHKHDAVEIEETTAQPEGTIIEEFVKGYKSGDRVLRPARVKVAKAPVNLDKEIEKS